MVLVWVDPRAVFKTKRMLGQLVLALLNTELYQSHFMTRTVKMYQLGYSPVLFELVKVWHAMETQGAHGVRSDFRLEPSPTVLQRVVEQAVVAPHRADLHIGVKTRTVTCPSVLWGWQG
jgi:hypothetical protein